MGAKELEYINGVLYAQSISDIAVMLEAEIRKSYKNIFDTKDQSVFYDGEFYKVYADVTRYDDDFHVTVYVFDSKECINDSMCGDIEDILNEAFEAELCENAYDIIEDQRF